MKKKKKWIYGLAAGISLVVIAAAVAIAFLLAPSNVYSRKINEAEKLVEEGDYDNAVLAYQEAIDQDPENVEAYLGLANLYESHNDVNSAINLLQAGYLRTDSLQIKVMLNRLLEAGGEEGEKSEGSAAINDGIFSIISAYSYRDYSTRYGIEDKSGNRDGSVTVRVTGMDADITFANTSSQPDAVSATIVDNDAVPTSITMDNILQLFGTASSVTYNDLSVMGLYDLARNNDSEHGEVVTFTYADAQVTIALDDTGAITSASWNEIVPSVEERQSFTDVLLTGFIIDAQTGGFVGNVHVTVREGTAETGPAVAEFDTDAGGMYEVDLPAGQYMFEIEADGYEPVFKEVYIGTYSKTTTEDFTITKSVAEGEVRIVLEWGTYPRDLDSYLIGETDEGEEVLTSYYSRTSEGDDGELIAELDLDDTDGLGPETTTLYDLNGEYTFSVVDFLGTGDINSSGATATFYLPGAAPQVVSIPTNFEGEVWRVATIDHGQLTIHNDAYGTTSAASK